MDMDRMRVLAQARAGGFWHRLFLCHNGSWRLCVVRGRDGLFAGISTPFARRGLSVAPDAAVDRTVNGGAS